MLCGGSIGLQADTVTLASGMPLEPPAPPSLQILAIARYRCGLRLVWHENPSLLFVSPRMKHYTRTRSLDARWHPQAVSIGTVALTASNAHPGVSSVSVLASVLASAFAPNVWPPFIAKRASMTSFKALTVALLFSGVASSVMCAPRIPVSDAEVVEHLPRRTDPAQQEFRALRGRLAASPDDMPLALTLARRYISQSRVEGDPRYLGYAQAALAPWYDKADPPPEVRVMRATLLQ